MDARALTDFADELSRSDPADLADIESIAAVYRLGSVVEALTTRSTAVFDAQQNWAPSGAQNAVAFITPLTRRPKPEVKKIVHRGRRLRTFPACEQAYAEGRINGAHVDLITGLENPTTAEALARDEEFLVGLAETLRYDKFVKTTDYWTQQADPNGAEEDDEGRRSRREAYLVASFGGMWLGKLTLDPISGSIVADEWDRLEKKMFEADWAKAKEELGHDPTPADLQRTPGQRRADALVEMATRSKTVPSDGRRPVPLFSVLVGYEQLRGRICELANGTVISPGSLVTWLDEALLERVVFDPQNRVTVSHTARFFTGGIRRGIVLRDRECGHPWCDVEATKCEVDHIIPSSEGGLTVESNGRVLCGFHNRQRNARPPPAD